MMSPIKKIEALVARDPNLKADAQRAFIAYMKSVYLMKNKDIFNVNSINVSEFAASLGLIVAPRIRFLRREEKRMNQTKTEEEPDISFFTKEEVDESDDSEDENNFLTIKRRDHELDANIPEQNTEKQDKKKQLVTKAMLAKKLMKKKIQPNKKTMFNEEGEVLLKKGKELASEKGRLYEMHNEGGGINIEESREILKEEDKFDKELFRERIKTKHKQDKKKLKDKEKEEEDEFDEEEEEEEDDVNSECDLSWLPDPDKIYNKNPDDNNSEEEEENSDNNDKDSKEAEESSSDNISQSDSEDSQIHRPPKRKLLDKNFVKNKRSKKFDTGLSLAEDEELALKLLQSGR